MSDQVDYEIRTIEQAVTVGKTLPISWFRGHSTTYALTPAVFRIAPTHRGGYREFWLAERFRLRASSIASTVPLWGDHLRWLLLMQHHGLPTRLLDWTESILVALFFAVRNLSDDDGEIWCIRPDALNNRSGYFLHSFDHPDVKRLAVQAFQNEGTKQERDLTKNPVAFLPPLEFPRMSAQSSRFTIHSAPSGTNTIEHLLRGPREVVRYLIPSACKKALWRDLIALEVTAETLFCSLDALSETIRLDVYDPDRGEDYPEPPVFERPGELKFTVVALDEGVALPAGMIPVRPKLFPRFCLVAESANLVACCAPGTADASTNP